MFVDVSQLSGLGQFARGFRAPTILSKVIATARPFLGPGGAPGPRMVHPGAPTVLKRVIATARPFLGPGGAPGPRMVHPGAPTVLKRVIATARPFLGPGGAPGPRMVHPGAPMPRVRMVARRPFSWPQPRPVSKIPTGVIAMPGVKRAAAIKSSIGFVRSGPTIAKAISRQFDAHVLKRRFELKMKSRGGAPLETTKIQVIKGIDPSTVGVKESGAATTGQVVSIKEPTPNTVTVTEQSGQLRIEPIEAPKSVAPSPPLFRTPPRGIESAGFISIETPTVDIIPSETFIDAAAAEKSNLVKYALYGLGAYVMMKSFADVKPKPRRRRPRRRR